MFAWSINFLDKRDLIQEEVTLVAKIAKVLKIPPLGFLL